MTIASSSECGPISLVTLFRTSMLVILFLYDMFNNRLKHRISNVVIFLYSSFVIVHISHAYKNIELTSDCMSRIFSFSFSVLSYHITFSLDRAAIVCPVIAKMSAFEPLSLMIAPKYLKLWLVIYFYFLCETTIIICNYLYFRRVNFHSICTCCIVDYVNKIG